MMRKLLSARWLSVLTLLAIVQHAGAQSEDDPLQQTINTVLEYLNNDQQCVLPTFTEVDQVYNCFGELERRWGDQLEARLTEDQRLMRETLLDDWANFKQRMDSAVIVRSAKKRQFLCKIEDYQEAKFGSSVCTRIKDIKGPITNHIFEKNPIVAYLKHLETGQVIERPVEPSPTIMSTSTTTSTTTTTTTSTTTTTTTTTTPTPIVPEPETTTEPEKPAELEIETTTEPEQQPEPEPETTTELEPDAELETVTESEQESGPQSEAQAETGPETKTETEPETGPSSSEAEIEAPTTEDEIVDEAGTEAPVTDEKKPEGEMGLARDEREEAGVQHTYIGRFTINLSKVPDEVTVTFKRERLPLDDERDPLDDIPVPSSNDDEALEQKDQPATQEEEEQQVSRASQTMFDELGAEYIDEEYDDAQLERLVRVPKKDWPFDPIFGYFKWPDECNAGMCPLDQQLDDSYLALNGAWYQFLADPNAYDEYLESIKPKSTTTVKPKFNAALLRRKKEQFEQSVQDESRRARAFGWENEHTPKKLELYMPEVNRDRWTKLADNGFCKISYNADYLKKKGKKSYKAVKHLFKSAAEPKSDGLDYDVHSALARESLLALKMSS